MKDVIVIVLLVLILIGPAILLYRAFKRAPYDNNPTEWHDPPITKAMREKLKEVSDAERKSEVVHLVREVDELLAKEKLSDAEKLQSLDAQIEKNYRELEMLDRQSIAKWKEIKRHSAELTHALELDEIERLR